MPYVDGAGVALSVDLVRMLFDVTLPEPATESVGLARRRCIERVRAHTSERGERSVDRGDAGLPVGGRRGRGARLRRRRPVATPDKRDHSPS